MSLLIFIVILVVLIWVHELGHFSVAKLFGVRVSEFAIGFPPRLFTVQWGETKYSLNLLLVGGYVRIFGEQADEGKGDPRSLVSKNRFIQAAVLLAGIFFNIIFAWLALSAAYMSGLPTAVEYKGFGEVSNVQVMIQGVRAGSPAERAGIQAGDVVESVQTSTAALDTKTLNTSQQASAVQKFITDHQDESVVLTVLRVGEEKTFLAKATEGVVGGRKAIGVELGDVGVVKLPLHLALLQAAVSAKDLTISTAQGLGGFFLTIVQGQADFAQVSGPIGIAGIGSQAVQQGFATAALLTALISINLAIINVLPIPGLDGGRLLIVIIEGVIRRPVSPRLANGLTLAGFALLVVLMLVVSYHDVTRLLG